MGERFIAQEEKEIRELEELAGGKNCKEHVPGSPEKQEMDLQAVDSCY